MVYLLKLLSMLLVCVAGAMCVITFVYLTAVLLPLFVMVPIISGLSLVWFKVEQRIVQIECKSIMGRTYGSKLSVTEIEDDELDAFEEIDTEEKDNEA